MMFKRALVATPILGSETWPKCSRLNFRALMAADISWRCSITGSRSASSYPFRLRGYGARCCGGWLTDWKTSMSTRFEEGERWTHSFYEAVLICSPAYLHPSCNVDRSLLRRMTVPEPWWNICMGSIYKHDRPWLYSSVQSKMTITIKPKVHLSKIINPPLLGPAQHWITPTTQRHNLPLIWTNLSCGYVDGKRGWHLLCNWPTCLYRWSRTSLSEVKVCPGFVNMMGPSKAD